jgi:hypothetical protein
MIGQMTVRRKVAGPNADSAPYQIAFMEVPDTLGGISEENLVRAELQEGQKVIHMIFASPFCLSFSRMYYPNWPNLAAHGRLTTGMSCFSLPLGLKF